jgi:ABC-type multidrug transport system ATPase subunit
MIINIDNITKTFDYLENVVDGVSKTLEPGTATAIKGRNGSGKSTLLKIIAGLSEPTSGKVSYSQDNEDVKLDRFCYIAPYYNLYEDYTPNEIFDLVCKLRNEKLDKSEYEDYLSKFDLLHKADVSIKNFSSGMKQRVKIIINLLGSQQAYFLDEPSSNLDKFGIETLSKEIENLKNNGKLVVIATNEQHEIDWCNNYIEL